MRKTLFSLLGILGLLFGSCSGKPKFYRIGMDSSWYPLDIPGRETALTAFSDELLQEIASLQKIQLQKVTVSWDKLLWGLQQKKDDLPFYEGILTSMQPYLFLEKQYSFSNVYLMTGPVLVVPFASSVKNLGQLNGKEIAVIQGSSNALILEKNPEIIVRTYGSVSEALNAIVSGTIDGALIDRLMAEAYCQDIYYQQLKIASSSLTDVGLRLVILESGPKDLLKAFNEGLEKLQKNGTYEKLLKKWNL